VSEDGPKRPCNSDGGWKIAFGGREGIGGGCALEEETSDKNIENRLGEEKKRNYSQSKEDKDFCPDACTMGDCVHTEGIKRSEDNENGCPTMVEREGKVDEELISIGVCAVEFLDYVVDMLERGVERMSWKGEKWHTVTAELTKRAKIKAGRGMREQVGTRG